MPAFATRSEFDTVRASRAIVARGACAAALLLLGGCGGGAPPGPPPPVAVAPAITTQPATVSVNTGVAATFTVVATGTAPLAYQWQRNTVDIAGATGASYSLASPVLADNGASFRVIITNAAGTVTSAAALLTVTTPNVAPTITTPPSDARVTAPATASFTVVAAGTPAPTLQWQLSVDNGTTWTNIAGAAAATYTTPATTTANSFNRFRAVATNVAGSVNSPLATLIVDPAVVADKLVLFAGSIGTRGSADGTTTAARFDGPYGMARDAAGNIYTTDWRNHTIRKVTAAGVVTTLAGLAGQAGLVDGSGSAARFNFPEGLAVDAAGNVYVADYGNNAIRKVTPAGVVTTVFSTGNIGGALVPGHLSAPSSVAVDASGALYVANTTDCTIVKIVGASASYLAGYPNRPGSADGADTTARFNYPSDVQLDGSGNLYVADQRNHTIRKIVLATGTVSTYAGKALVGGFADGTGTAALFADPVALVLGPGGVMYVSDFTNNVIRKIAPGGGVTTVLGVVRSDPGNDFRTGPDPRLGSPLYMAMIDATHVVLGMATFNSGLYIATVP